jgi:hypothetical protein
MRWLPPCRPEEIVSIQLETHAATCYLQPLREGGSLPAVVDTEAGMFVAKFRGAGQGVKALVAELLAALLARALGLPVPETVLIEISPLFGRTEGDPEIQDLLRASHGTNLGTRYLDGAFNFDPYAAGALIDAELAADIVWFDAFLTNPDRTARNPNILIWERRPWLIDHGAAIYAHHDWRGNGDERARTPFPLIKHHVLLGQAGDIEAADARLAPRVTGGLVDDVLAAVPDSLLRDPTRPHEPEPPALRDRYRGWLMARAAGPREFVAEAVRAKREHRDEPPRRRPARR